MIMFNLWIILVLIKRNGLKYLNMNSALICMLLPATQVVIYCLVYSKPMIEMKIAVFNEEDIHVNSNNNNSDYLTTGAVAADQTTYSHNILESLKPMERHLLRPVGYPTLASAIQAVVDGQAVGAVWFHQNYSDSMDSRLDNPYDADQDILTSSSLHVYVDNSQIIFGNIFMHSLSDAVWSVVSNLTTNQPANRQSSSAAPGASGGRASGAPLMMDIPIRVEKTPKSANLIFKDTGLAANLMFFIYLSQIVLSSLGLTQERKDGLFERSLVAGVGHHLVLVSHLLTNLALACLQIGLMYLAAFYVFNEVNNGTGMLAAGLLLAMAVNAVTSGLVISAALYEEYHCMIVLGFLCAPQLFTSGMFWPLESLDPLLQLANRLSPLCVPVETMRNIILRGWPLANRAVMFGFAVTLAPSLLFLVLALFIFRYRQF